MFNIGMILVNPSPGAQLIFCIPFDATKLLVFSMTGLSTVFLKGYSTVIHVVNTFR